MIPRCSLSAGVTMVSVSVLALLKYTYILEMSCSVNQNDQENEKKTWQWYEGVHFIVCFRLLSCDQHHLHPVLSYLGMPQCSTRSLPEHFGGVFQAWGHVSECHSGLCHAVMCARGNSALLLLILSPGNRVRVSLVLVGTYCKLHREAEN